MYSKKTTAKIIDELYPKLKTQLQLTDYDIELFIVSKKSPELLEVKKEHNGHALYGFCETTGKKAKVYIVYNQHNSYKSLYGTLFHELLHVKLDKLTAKRGRNRSLKSMNKEEEIVHCLEHFILEFI